MVGLVHLFAMVLAAFAFALLGPVLVGTAYGEFAAAARFLLVAGLVGFAAGGVFFASQGRPRRFGRAGGYVFAVAVWTLPPVVGAIPFVWIGGLDHVSGLFEAVSGYTTTGATVYPSLTPVGRSLLFWRAELQWLGGLATLVMVTTILAPGGIGGLPARHIGLLDPVTPGGGYRLLTVARDILVAYSVTTFACLVLLLTVGMPMFDAFCLAFATVSTGGFAVRDGGLAVYENGGAEWILAIFMIVGATSVLWQKMVVGRRWQLLAEHRESYAVIAASLLVGFLFAVLFHARTSGEGAFTAIRHGLVNGASLVSTTGFEIRPGSFGLLPLTLVLMIALAGGGIFSTAGGIKYYRLGGMLVQSLQELTRLIYPHGVRTSRFGSQPYDMQMMKAIWGHLALAMAVIQLCALLVALTGVDYIGAMTAAMASFANIGPIFENGFRESAGWPGYGELAAGAKLTLAATMIVGRLEIVALLGALSIVYWRS